MSEFRFMVFGDDAPDDGGYVNLARDGRLRLMAECVVTQQRAGFGDVLDLRQCPCPECGQPGFNTGLGYFRHTCGAEVTNGEDPDCSGCSVAAARDAA